MSLVCVVRESIQRAATVRKYVDQSPGAGCTRTRTRVHNGKGSGSPTAVRMGARRGIVAVVRSIVVRAAIPGAIWSQSLIKFGSKACACMRWSESKAGRGLLTRGAVSPAAEPGEAYAQSCSTLAPQPSHRQKVWECDEWPQEGAGNRGSDDFRDFLRRFPKFFASSRSPCILFRNHNFVFLRWVCRKRRPLGLRARTS